MTLQCACPQPATFFNEPLKDEKELLELLKYPIHRRPHFKCVDCLTRLNGSMTDANILSLVSRLKRRRRAVPATNKMTGKKRKYR